MGRELIPDEPPGRINRKARHFEAEITRLRAEGYTLAAIRRALAAAGIDVSLATIRRELKKTARHAPVNAARAGPPPSNSAIAGSDHPCAPPSASRGTEARPPTLLPKTSTSLPLLSDPSSSKDLAEAFFLQLDTNPLLRKKEPR